jgi:hypothetical protein
MALNTEEQVQWYPKYRGAATFQKYGRFADPLLSLQVL